VGLVGGLLFLHVSLFVLGRLNGGEFFAKLCPPAYYANFFWVFLIVLIFSLIDFNYFSEHHRMLSWGLIICCLAVTVTNVRLTLELNRTIRDNFIVRRAVFADIQRSIQASRTGQPFTFAMTPADEQALPWIKRADGTPGHNNYFELIYLKNYDEADPACTYEIHQTDFVRRCRDR
jgi:hypothetical protein